VTASGDARREVGRNGENATAAWFEAAGYEILDRNWRVRGGELDLIVRRGATLVFCEVKTRRGDAFGVPAESVTARKQARIRSLAAQWLAAHPLRADVLRFDVADVRPDGRGAWIVDVIEGAF
jgi:putative endonuclease